MIKVCEICENKFETKSSKELKEKIEEFWKKAVEENPKRPYLSNLINEIVRERGNEND